MFMNDITGMLMSIDAVCRYDAKLIKLYKKPEFNVRFQSNMLQIDWNFKKN